MKTIGAAFVSIISIALLFGGCSNRADQLEKEKAELQEAIKSRDQFMQDILASINEVHSKLESARARENTIMQQTNAYAEKKGAVNVADRESILRQITDIDSSLSENRQKLANLESKLKSSKIQYASLNKMVSDLKQSLEEREQAITQLNDRISGLENQVAEKTRLVAVKDSVIDQRDATVRAQTELLNTAYYVVGKKDDLESMGIIKNDGGFLWGLIGSTTVLANGFDNSYFKPIDKSREMTIEVAGKIDKIVPERNEGYYVKEEKSDSLSTLRITRPDYFWQENLLVVVTK